MDNFTIEKGIPIPPRSNNYPSRKGCSKYPFLKMEVGDSVFFKLPGGHFTKRAMAKVTSSLGRTKVLNPSLKFATRKVEGGVRIWRLV